MDGQFPYLSLGPHRITASQKAWTKLATDEKKHAGETEIKQNYNSRQVNILGTTFRLTQIVMLVSQFWASSEAESTNNFLVPSSSPDHSVVWA